MKNLLRLLFCFLLLFSAVQAKDVRFAQISEVRFNANTDNATFKKVIKNINKQENIEFVIFTGDSIDKPTQKNLKSFLKTAKKLNCPFYIVIGDKDVNKIKHLGKSDYLNTVRKYLPNYLTIKNPNYVFKQSGVIFIVLDGAKDVIPSRTGYFKDDVVDWLDSKLTKYENKHVIIFQHFPIVEPYNKENYHTYKPEKYLAVLEKHSNVRAIISGHFGVNKEQTINEINHISTKGIPYYRVIDIIDSDKESPIIWAELKRVD